MWTQEDSCALEHSAVGACGLEQTFLHTHWSNRLGLPRADPVEYQFCGILSRYYMKEGFCGKISLGNNTKLNFIFSIEILEILIY